ncbi:hypothetical protein PGN83_10720 [Klebsiella aerogenes]
MSKTFPNKSPYYEYKDGAAEMLVKLSPARKNTIKIYAQTHGLTLHGALLSMVDSYYDVTRKSAKEHNNNK